MLARAFRSSKQQAVVSAARVPTTSRMTCSSSTPVASTVHTANLAFFDNPRSSSNFATISAQRAKSLGITWSLSDQPRWRAEEPVVYVYNSLFANIVGPEQQQQQQRPPQQQQVAPPQLLARGIHIGDLSMTAAQARSQRLHSLSR